MGVTKEVRTNLQSIWEEIDLMQNTDDVNKNIGKMAYILINNDTLVGSTKVADMNKYLLRTEVISSYTEDPSDVTLLYGLVLNVCELPTKLPDDISIDGSLFVMMREIDTAIEYEEMCTIEEIVDYIEHNIHLYGSLDINDFSVIFGTKLNFSLNVISPVSTHINLAQRAALGVR